MKAWLKTINTLFKALRGFFGGPNKNRPGAKTIPGKTRAERRCAWKKSWEKF